jgi:hypothetical protein
MWAAFVYVAKFVALYLASALASNVLGRLLGRKSQADATPWEVPPVASGTKVPFLFGTARVRPIPVDFLNDELVPIKDGKSEIGKNHYVTYMGLLCWGMILGFANIIVNGNRFITRFRSRYALGHDDDGNPLFSLDATPALTTVPPSPIILFDHGLIKLSIALPDIYQKFDGIGGDIWLYRGTGERGPDPILEAKYGAGNVSAYRDYAYVVFDRFRMGMDPSRPIDLVLTRPVGTEHNSGLAPALERVIDNTPRALLMGWGAWTVMDVTIPSVLLELFRDRRWALGIDESECDHASFDEAAFWTTNGTWAPTRGGIIGVSGIITTPEEARELKDQCLRAINASLVRHPQTNLYQIKQAYNEAPTPEAADALPTYHERHIKRCKVTLRTWAETFNEITVEFTNPVKFFDIDTVTVRNDASIGAIGRRPKTLNFKYITNPATALSIAMRECRAASTPLELQELECTRAMFDITQGDVFRINFAAEGYENRIVRALSTSLGTPRAGRIVIQAIDDVFAQQQIALTVVESGEEANHIILPTVAGATTSLVDPSTGRLSIFLDDPERRIYEMAYRTKVGNDDVSDWTVVATATPDTSDPFPFNNPVTDDDFNGLTTFDVPIGFDGPSTIEYRIRYVGAGATVADPTLNFGELRDAFDFPARSSGPTSQDLANANPIVWDVTGKINDTATVSGFVTGGRSLVIIGAEAGFHGRLIIRSNVAGHTLTLPDESIIGDGSSLDVILSLRDQLSVYYDGTHYWWNLETSASELVPINLASAVSASATAVAALQIGAQLASAATISATATADLQIGSNLASAVAASATAIADLTTASGNPIAAKTLGDWKADNFTDNGAKILTLTDASTHANHLAQATDASRLTLAHVATVSGKQVLQFTGGESYFLDPLIAGTMPPRDDIALITICRPDNSIQKVCLQVGTDGSVKGFGLSPQTSGNFFGALINGITWSDSEVAKDNVNRHFFLCNRNGNVLRYYRNGRPLFPIDTQNAGAGYTRVAIPGTDHMMPGDWRRSILANSLTETEIWQLATALAASEGTTDSGIDPTTVQNQDDDFTFGASIDTTGARRTSSIPWSSFNAGGSLANAVSSGKVRLTLPQASSDIYRGFTQPDPNTDATTYTYWVAKLIPTQVAANGNKVAVACMDTVGQRMLSMSLGMVSGVRQIALERHYSIFGGGDFDGNQSGAVITGFTSTDFTKEWTFHLAWNKTILNCWFQIDGGAMQALGAVSTGFFNSGLRANKIGILVSSGNAAGGDTIGDITDFKRMI